MDRQSGLNDRINETIREFHADCEGSLTLEEVLAALEDAKSDAPTVLGVPTDDEMARMRALYEGEKRAGLARPVEEIERDIREAGRGHLLRD